MIVVRLKPSDFLIPLQHLNDLAAECFGRMLHEEMSGPGSDAPWNQPSGQGEQEPWEFGFEDAHGFKARDLAVAFATCLQSFKRPTDSGPPTGDPHIKDG